jgi:hypothetical protein
MRGPLIILLATSLAFAFGSFAIKPLGVLGFFLTLGLWAFLLDKFDNLFDPDPNNHFVARRDKAQIFERQRKREARKRRLR